MRTLIVFAHPSAESYGAALLDLARRTLETQGHDLHVIDLYREGFDPVLSPEDWALYQSHPERLADKLRRHVDAMLWAESLVLIYPTWMYGPPAILKGWLERVWLPGVAFGIPSAKGKRPSGNLRNIVRFTVVTTSGSPWWWLRLIRDPNRSLMMRGFRMLFNRKCRTTWLQLHSMNHRTKADRLAFLDRVERKLARI